MYSTAIPLINSQASPPRIQRSDSLDAGAAFDLGDRGEVLDDPKRLQSAAANRVAVSLNFMKAHLNQPIRISTLCALVGLSPSRFFELFKSATGETPLNWLIQTRMRRAGELLEETTLQIKQVAVQVGYEDQFYFSRLFKAVHGISPSGYRKQKGKEHLGQSDSN